jgi:hypothetical protein
LQGVLLSSLPNPKSFPTHIISQPFHIFLECSYHFAFPVLNYFQLLGLFDYQKPKTSLTKQLQISLSSLNSGGTSSL